ncbi:MAG: hypothetical protein KF865_01885 [Bdellovibrionaceae bacterium]|nr:hypothetical protein [Pseudobdellovibrionaceae bacterium]
MKCLSRAFTLLLVSSVAFAQANEDAVHSAAPVESAETPVAPVGTPDWEKTQLPAGFLPQPVTAPAAVNPAAAVPLQALTLPAAALESGGSGGGGGLAALAGACVAALGAGGIFGSTPGNQETVKLVGEQADKLNDYFGYQYEPSLDRQFAEQMGAEITAHAPGCENNFINKEGRLGPWGRTALQEIRDRPQSYVKNIPPDVLRMCPNYGKFDEKKREQFWVWMFLSLAAPESSCKANAANKNAPNGVAKGLFQLEKPLCDRVGVYGNLYEPHTNVRCAVKALGVELDRRDNLMSPTSKGSDSRRTYWGPLRNDHHNKQRGGDIAGAKKFENLLKQFKGCRS